MKRYAIKRHVQSDLFSFYLTFLTETVKVHRHNLSSKYIHDKHVALKNVFYTNMLCKYAIWMETIHFYIDLKLTPIHDLNPTHDPHRKKYNKRDMWWQYFMWDVSCLQIRRSKVDHLATVGWLVPSSALEGTRFCLTPMCECLCMVVEREVLPVAVLAGKSLYIHRNT